MYSSNIDLNLIIPYIYKMDKHMLKILQQLLLDF